MRNVDLLLHDWRAAGLNVPCGLKSQLATVDARLVLKAVGTLSTADQSALERRLRAWLSL